MSSTQDSAAKLLHIVTNAHTYNIGYVSSVIDSASTAVIWAAALQRPFLRDLTAHGALRVRVMRYGKTGFLYVISNGRVYIASYTWRNLAKRALLGGKSRVAGSQLQKRGVVTLRTHKLAARGNTNGK